MKLNIFIANKELESGFQLRCRRRGREVASVTSSKSELGFPEVGEAINQFLLVIPNLVV